MENVAPYLDHTYLRPDTTMDDIKRMISEAQELGFAAICIPPHFVRDARRIMGEYNPVKLCTVVGFPLGYAAISSKSEEIKRAVEEGADEVDAVINLAAYRTKQMNHFRNDIESMVRATHLKAKILKVILETNLMEKSEILDAGLICKEMGANYIKTGTGFFGATELGTVDFLRKNLPGDLKIKAAGGIKTLKDARAMIAAGADRIGTSSALQILAEQNA